MQAFHARAYAAGNAVIALVGDLSRSEAEAIANQVSAALPPGPALAKIDQPQAPKPGVSHIEYPSNQTHLMIAQLGIDRRDPDYAALYLGNQIFGGGGFGTRLMSEVREKRGLTYGVYSGFSAMQARGPFMINLQTRADLSEGTWRWSSNCSPTTCVTAPPSRNWTTQSANWPVASRCPPRAMPPSSASWRRWASTTCR